MAKVSYIKLAIDTPDPKTYEVHYQGKSANRKTKLPGFYVNGLPSDFCRITDIRSDGYDTEVALSDTMHRAVNIYREFHKNSKRVILFRCSASAELRMEKVKQGHYIGHRKGISHKIRGTDYGADEATIGISYIIAEKIQDSAKTEYFRTDPANDYQINGRITSDLNYTVIDWTEEREAFFSSLYDSMRVLLDKMNLFFGEDADKAALFIDNNPLLLTGKTN